MQANKSNIAVLILAYLENIQSAISSKSWKIFLFSVCKDTSMCEDKLPLILNFFSKLSHNQMTLLHNNSCKYNSWCDYASDVIWIQKTGLVTYYRLLQYL